MVTVPKTCAADSGVYMCSGLSGAQKKRNKTLKRMMLCKFMRKKSNRCLLQIEIAMRTNYKA